MSKMTHRQARNLLQASIDYKLTRKRQALLDAHLVECRDCTQYACQMQGLEADLRRLMQERWEGKKGKFSNETVKVRSRRIDMRKKTWNTIKALGAITLLVFLAIVLSSFFRQQGSSNLSQPTAPNQMSTPTAVESKGTPTSVKTGVTSDGDWFVSINVGKFILTVANMGTMVKKIDYQFSKSTCGGIQINPSEIVDASSWLIIENQFTIHSTLDRTGQFTIDISGVYDMASQKLSGTWMAAIEGSACSGTWEAQAPETSGP